MAKKEWIKEIILLAAILFLAGCASQKTPTGGPVDTTPPEIIEVQPADQTINYKENKIKLKFSEYVEARTVLESIFISPNIDGKIEYNWSGTSLEIKLPDSLRANTTYTITIGTDVEDVNNSNKMAQAYTFAFSTGDKIDKGKISGRVLDKESSGIMIYSYKITGDTLNPSVTKPDYISQTGLNGTYRLSGLADGTYRVFAVRDEYKDYLYNPTQDAFGVPYSDITLDTANQEVNGLNFFMQLSDTTSPRIQNVTMTDQHHMLIEFGESIDSSTITNKNFYIYDSLNSEKIEVNYFYKGKTKAKNFLVSFKDSIKNEESVQLIAENFSDPSGNITQIEKTPVVVNDKPDTTYPANYGFVAQYPDSTVDFVNGWVKLSYEDACDIENVAPKAITVLDPGKKSIEYKIEKIDDASFKVVFERLKAYNKYTMKVDQKYFVDAAGNKLDSVYTYYFSSVNTLEFSGLSGAITPPESVDGTMMVLIENLPDKTITQKQAVTSNTFNLERVVPGQYFLWSFIDRNNNGEYDKGNIYPFEPSERFIFYSSDSLNLRPRWPVGDADLNYGK